MSIWDVMPGEVHCLVGENGCGKSTLIKIVAGVHAPDPGSGVEIGGRDVLPMTPTRAHALGVQVIFQDLSLFPEPQRRRKHRHRSGAVRPCPRAVCRDAPDRPRGAGPAGVRPAARRARRRPAGRRTPDRRDLPRPRRRGEAGVHGRADLLADPRRGRPAARDRRAAEGGEHRRRVRLAQARRGRGDRRARHGAARRPQGRHVRGRRATRAHSPA